MTFTDEQFNALSKYEIYFQRATKENWSNYPGSNALDFILSIYNDATYLNHKIVKSCGNCVLNFLKDCGTLYFKDKAERETGATLKTKKSKRK